MAVKTTTCPTCESTLRTTTCDRCEFTEPTTAMHKFHATAVVPDTHRHPNDLPMSRRSFEQGMARLLDQFGADLFG